MKIALIYTLYHHRKFSENLKVVDEEFTASPPIILAYVAAILERAGHNVILIDAHTMNLSKDDVIKKLNLFKPDMLGFRVDTYNFQETLEWIRDIRIMTGIPVIAGGLNMSLYAEETMSHPEIDFAIIGEAAESLPLFLKEFEEKKQYSNVPGLCWRENGSLFINKPSDKPVPFDIYPFPSRHLLNNEIYHSFVSQKKNFTVMLTSTGCPYRCSFCAIAALKQYRERSWESIIREMEECYYDYGIREIDFFDATFFVNREKSLKVLQEMRRRKLDITWTCRSRVDIVDEELLREASSSGCRMIFWGIESSSQKMLDSVSKGINTVQTMNAIRLSKKHGIRNLGFLMVGSPGETPQTVKATVDFSKKLGLDYVQICRTIAKPGTELHKQMVKSTGYDYWKDFVLCRKEEMRMPTPWHKLNQEKIEKLLKWAYYSFYFRPSFIMHTLLKIRSIFELSRYVKVATRMLFHYFYTDIRLAGKSGLVKKIAHWKIEDNKSIGNIIARKVAVIIPTYNESQNIPGLLKKIVTLYPSLKIFVVDSCSTDGTPDIVKRFAVLYPQVQLLNNSKYTGHNERGMAVKDGVHAALSQGMDAVIEMDADLSHDPQFIEEFLYWINESDIVIGSRYVPGSAEIGRSILRRIISYTANFYVRYRLGIKNITDCTSGFRCYNRHALETIDIDSIRSNEGTSSLIEIAYRAVNENLKIKEIPISYRERIMGSSKFSIEVIKSSFKTVTLLGSNV